MSDEIRRRLHDLRRGQEAELESGAEEEEAVASGAGFGQVGLSRRAELMVELRKKDGDCKALSYGYLLAVDYTSRQIVLQFVGWRVTLAGRQLARLKRGLVGHRVTWVQEEDDLASRAKPDEATVVTSIEIVEDK